MNTLHDTDRHQVLRIADNLVPAFLGTYSNETIERFVAASFDQLASRARITTYLPVLTERFASDGWRALAQTPRSHVSDVPDVLFVWVHNAGRSQMAAALLDHHARGRVHVRSAGSQPADEVNPAVVEALNEIGLDVAKEFPKPLTDEIARAADVIVTMGCGDACPVHPGKRYLDWQLPDPAGKPIEQVRPTCDEIDRRVQQLLDDLLA